MRPTLMNASRTRRDASPRHASPACNGPPKATIDQQCDYGETAITVETMFHAGTLSARRALFPDYTSPPCHGRYLARDAGGRRADGCHAQRRGLAANAAASNCPCHPEHRRHTTGVVICTGTEHNGVEPLHAWTGLTQKAGQDTETTVLRKVERVTLRYPLPN
jgi:hypothetical protein